jgi:hypothetical protein
VVNGYIYGSEIAGGVDVFRMTPSKFLTQEEIDASNQVHLDILNVQSQPKIVWPQNPIVGKAYVAQLERSAALPAARTASLKAAIAKVEQPGASTKDSTALKAMGDALDKDAAKAKPATDAGRMRALAAIIRESWYASNRNRHDSHTAHRIRRNSIIVRAGPVRRRMLEPILRE